MRRFVALAIGATAAAGLAQIPSASASVIDEYFPSGLYEPVGEVSGTNPGISINTHNDFATYFGQTFVALPGLAQDLTFNLGGAQPGQDGIDFRVLIAETKPEGPGTFSPTTIVYSGPLLTLGPQLGTFGTAVLGPVVTVNLGGLDLVDGALYEWVLDTVTTADGIAGYSGLLYNAHHNSPGNSSVLVWDLKLASPNQPWINEADFDLSFRLSFSEGGIADPTLESLGSLPVSSFGPGFFVPEPDSLPLFASGLALLGWLRGTSIGRLGARCMA